MAIRNIGQKYYLKTGDILEVNSDDVNYLWVGGGPIGVNEGTGDVTGDMSSEGLWVPAEASGVTYIGVAYHSFVAIDDTNPLMTWVTEPSILILEQGTDEGEDDAVRPWYHGNTYHVGDLLRPRNYTHPVTGVIYSSWTNDAWTTEAASSVIPYYAVILQVYGTAAAPTALKIQLTNRFKQT